MGEMSEKVMYKNKEKKLNLLLDKLLLYTTEKEDLKADAVEDHIFDFLRANKGVLPIDIQKKILQILPVSHSYTLLKAIQSKEYQHLGCEVVKLLDLSDPFSVVVLLKHFIKWVHISLQTKYVHSPP